jgi:hypothetical protein
MQRAFRAKGTLIRPFFWAKKKYGVFFHVFVNFCVVKHLSRIANNLALKKSKII